MSRKLDRKDRKILFQLDINSRQSNASIAKKIRLSKQVVGFRIKKMLEQRVISSFYTIIDISRFELVNHKSFLRLQNLSNEKERELISYLTHHPDILWLASCDGKFDLAFGTLAKNMEHLDRTLKEIDSRYGSYISDRQIASIVRGQYFVRDYLIDKTKASDLQPFFGSVPNPIKMASRDWSILNEIAKNSRITSVELAHKLSLSPDAISSRIKKLEQNGVIRHYSIVPNEAVFPYIHYKVLIGLRNMSSQKEQLLIEYCKRHPHIVYIVKALGPWEFEIDMEVENTQQFRTIMMDLKTKFKEIIKDYSALHIYKVHKYNFCPSIQK